jgi:hypothetical protein
MMATNTQMSQKRNRERERGKWKKKKLHLLECDTVQSSNILQRRQGKATGMQKWSTLTDLLLVGGCVNFTVPTEMVRITQKACQHLHLA